MVASSSLFDSRRIRSLSSSDFRLHSCSFDTRAFSRRISSAGVIRWDRLRSLAYSFATVGSELHEMPPSVCLASTFNSFRRFALETSSMPELASRLTVMPAKSAPQGEYKGVAYHTYSDVRLIELTGVALNPTRIVWRFVALVRAVRLLVDETLSQCHTSRADTRPCPRYPLSSYYAFFNVSQDPNAQAWRVCMYARTRQMCSVLHCTGEFTAPSRVRLI